jgi:serine/threonine protein kinase
MSRLRSPNVVGYVESGLSKDNDVYWLVMELLEAESLDRILEIEGPMPELDVIRVRQYILHVIIHADLSLVLILKSLLLTP